MDDPIFDPWCLGEESQPAPAQRTSRWRSAAEGGSTWFELPAPASRPGTRPETASEPASETDPQTTAEPARRAGSNDEGDRPIRSSASALPAPSPPAPPSAPAPTPTSARTPAPAQAPTSTPTPTSAHPPASASPRVPPPTLDAETPELPNVWDLAALRPSETADPIASPDQGAQADARPWSLDKQPLPEREATRWSLDDAPAPARPPRAPRRRTLDGAVTAVRNVLVPCVEAMSGQLVTAGHQATVDNRLAERPPSYRFRVVPWRGPFDDTETGPGGVLEIVIEGPHGDSIMGRIWLDPYSPAPTDERSIPRSDFSAEWLDKLLLDLVRGVLRHP